MPTLRKRKLSTGRSLRWQRRQCTEQEDRLWDQMPAIGRELGSPDFDRLLELDEAAYATFQSWERVRQWLATPLAALDGDSPESAARHRDGFNKVMALLKPI